MTNTSELAANTVLVVLAESTGARACLDAAAVAAAALTTPTITGLHIRVDPVRDILPTEEILLPERERAMEIEAIEEGRSLREVFLKWTHGLGAESKSAWLDVPGGIDEDVERLGAQAALNVMPYPSKATHGHARLALHTCLFKTHRPLLVVPHDYAPSPLRRILVGWKDTPPGRRALECALPWLRCAAAVRVVCVGRPEPLELAWAKEQFLDQNVEAEVLHVDRRDGMSAGEQLLEEAKQYRADWLVSGAYGHSQLAEWVFGGVTKRLLGEATLPLFLSH
jgi:nucleotide-binding universal stress UspA family protein